MFARHPGPCWRAGGCCRGRGEEEGKRGGGGGGLKGTNKIDGLWNERNGRAGCSVRTEESAATAAVQPKPPRRGSVELKGSRKGMRP